MVLSEKWIKKVFNLWEDEKKDKVKEEIFQFRMRYYHKLERIEDKIFLDYRMGYLEYLSGNTDLANVYFGYLDEIYKDDYVMKSCEYDYYRYRWLYVNNNKKTLSDKEKIDEMIKVYNYYKTIERNDLAKASLENISNLKGNQEEILSNLESLLNEKKIQENHLILSILKDCEDISHNLYIKALDIVNKYNINIQAV